MLFLVDNRINSSSISAQVKCHRKFFPNKRKNRKQMLYLSAADSSPADIKVSSRKTPKHNYVYIRKNVRVKQFIKFTEVHDHDPISPAPRQKVSVPFTDILKLFT